MKYKIFDNKFEAIADRILDAFSNNQSTLLILTLPVKKKKKGIIFQNSVNQISGSHNLERKSLNNQVLLMYVCWRHSAVSRKENNEFIF